MRTIQIRLVSQVLSYEGTGEPDVGREFLSEDGPDLRS
jgi:hypothetical protein